MDNLRRALAGVGASFEHIVCARAVLVHFERDYAAFIRVYAGYFAPDRLPVRTTQSRPAGLSDNRFEWCAIISRPP